MTLLTLTLTLILSHLTPVALVDQHKPILGVARFERGKRLVGVDHGVLLNPRFDLVIGSKLQHIRDIRGIAND